MLMPSGGGFFFLLFCEEYSLKCTNLKQLVIILDSWDHICIMLNFGMKNSLSQVVNQGPPVVTEAIAS